MAAQTDGRTRSHPRRVRVLCACAGALAALAPIARAAPASAAQVPRFAAAFSAIKPEAVAQAAASGITTDILYGGPPKPRSKLAAALASAHMSVIDARLSGVLFDWECHRTHTVAPPPPGERNSYCRKDWDPAMDSNEAVLSATRELI